MKIVKITEKDDDRIKQAKTSILRLIKSQVVDTNQLSTILQFVLKSTQTVHRSSMSSEVDHYLFEHDFQCDLLMNGYSFDATRNKRESTEKHRKSNRISDNPLRLATHSLRQALFNFEDFFVVNVLSFLHRQLT